MNENPKNEPEEKNDEGIKPIPDWLKRNKEAEKRRADAATERKKLQETLQGGKETLKENLAPEIKKLGEDLDEGKRILKENLGKNGNKPEEYEESEKQAA